MATKPVEKQEYTNNKDRLAALKRAARATNAKLGIDGITMASDLEATTRAPFGIPDLDTKTGGGIPHGAVSIIWGEPGSTKSTLAMYLAAQAQKDGKLVAWAALETFDAQRAKKIGVNLEEMPVLQFPKAEQVLDVMIQYAQEKLVDVFILDSIHSLAPKGMQEDSKGQKSMEDNTMGVLARKLSEFFPRFTDAMKRSNMAVLLIGQTRIKIGFISIEALTGGNALHHAGRFIMRVRRGAKDDAPFQDKVVDGKKEKVQIGFNTVFKFDKVQVTGCQPEQTSFGLPFYFESAFELPADLKEEIAKEEAEIAAQEAQEAPKVVEATPTMDNTVKEAVIDANSEETPKKKRGRPSKKV